MTQRVSRSVVVRRSCDDVAELLAEPDRVFGAIPGFARFTRASDSDGADEEIWDVFLAVGTLQIGGRVHVSRPSPHRLEWHSVRGTRHSFAMSVEPLGARSTLAMTLEYSLTGLLMARLSEVLGRGIAARHLEAALEQVRHYLEYGESITGP